MYKTDKEKASKIIESLSPPLILINGPWAIGKTTFCKQFSDYSIYNFDTVEKLHKYLENRKEKKLNHTPLIIKAEIKDAEIIDKMFVDDHHNFSYVFMYPNNGENYKKQVVEKLQKHKPTGYEDLAEEFQKSGDQKYATKITAKLMKDWREIYQQHTEHFQDRIFTILNSSL
jgi:hypothetical protein